MTLVERLYAVREAGMDAVQLERDGGPLVVRRVPDPRPGRGEVLVQVAAAPINPSDLGFLTGRTSPRGLFRSSRGSREAARSWLRGAAPAPAAATAPAAPAKAPKAAAPASSARSSSSITVLVAHENEAVRNMIGDVLLDAEYKVETASEGVEALKKATELRPQAMVLDVGLPGIYGFELCERLKDDNQTREMKIILLTSTYDMSRYKRTPVSLYGADDYIEKHHIADELAPKIRKLIHPEEYAEAPAPEAESALLPCRSC